VLFHAKGTLMKISVPFLLSLALLCGSSGASAQAKGASKAPKGCMTISGTISGTVTSAPGASETVVQGTVVGSLRGSVQATVSSLEQQPDGSLRLKLSHNFVTEEGFLLQTADTAKLTPVPGMKNVFQQSTEYKVTGGTGRYAAARGTFTNHGEADLGRGLLTLRYEGRICGLAP
jgi:hypothetical protein